MTNKGKDGKTLERFLEHGDYFGEGALLSENKQRNAWVIALTQVKTMEIDY